jgi:hypothetical protein
MLGLGGLVAAIAAEVFVFVVGVAATAEVLAALAGGVLLGCRLEMAFVRDDSDDLISSKVAESLIGGGVMGLVPWVRRWSREERLESMF